MVMVPIDGPRVENCIPKPICNESITDIVRSLIDSPYAISKYEITFDDYDLFSEETGREAKEDNGWGRGTYPVIFVAWRDALAYADWLSVQTGHTYRLPTVVEWEHAARAGTQSAYWWGPELERNRANCSECGSRWSRSQTAPVGSFPPNPWGIYDMHGNVREFTQDCALRGEKWHPFNRYRYKLGDKPRFHRECHLIHVKGSSWGTTLRSPYRKETAQNDPLFPSMWHPYTWQRMTSHTGIRVVRVM